MAESFDVVVVGSGAGGMAAALTAAHHGLSVCVIEKTAFIGGSTAVSGGAVWVPGNPHLAEVGLTDSRAAVVEYLRAIIGNRYRADMIDAYLDHGPEMVTFFEAHTALKFSPRAVSPDYQALPGAASGGRTIDPLPYDGRQLGKAFALLRPPLDTFLAFGGMMVGRKDIDTLLGTFSAPANMLGTLKLLGRYARDRLTHKRGTRLLMGNAMAARLLASALKAGISIKTQTAAKELLVDGGRVAAVRVTTKAGESTLHARRGVVLASGGFPASVALRAQMLPHADQHYSMAPEGNQGDGLSMARAIGASVVNDNAGNAFWAPVSVMRMADGSRVRFPHLIMDRQKPGLIAVDQSGRRFVNEATSYHEFVEAMHAAHETRPSIPCWLICDHRFIRRYGLGLVRPGPRSFAPFIKAGYLIKADSIAALAGKIGAEPEALAASVAQMNEAARTGVDAAFGKGSSAYHRYLGDGNHKPNPCLGPIDTPPFYAVQVFPGDIGSAAGLATDAKARVLGESGAPINGLYAVGNDMNSVMAGTYPAAGITLGPALTFGYIAGRDLAGL